MFQHTTTVTRIHNVLHTGAGLAHLLRVFSVFLAGKILQLELGWSYAGICLSSVLISIDLKSQRVFIVLTGTKKQIGKLEKRY